MFDQQNCFTVQATTGVWTQALTTDAVSTNVIDIEAANLKFNNPSKPMYLIVKVTVTGISITTSLQVKLENSAAAAMSSLKNIMTRNIAAASLTAGALIFNDVIPVGIYLQYMRLDFDMVGGDGTCTVFGALSDSPESASTIIASIEA